MYSICDVKSNEKSTLKGYNSHSSNNEYHNVLQHKKTLRHQLSRIRCKKR